MSSSNPLFEKSLVPSGKWKNKLYALLFLSVFSKSPLHAFVSSSLSLPPRLNIYFPYGLPFSILKQYWKWTELISCLQYYIKTRVQSSYTFRWQFETIFYFENEYTVLFICNYYGIFDMRDMCPVLICYSPRWPSWLCGQVHNWT